MLRESVYWVGFVVLQACHVDDYVRELGLSIVVVLFDKRERTKEKKKNKARQNCMPFS